MEFVGASHRNAIFCSDPGLNFNERIITTAKRHVTTDENAVRLLDEDVVLGSLADNGVQRHGDDWGALRSRKANSSEHVTERLRRLVVELDPNGERAIVDAHNAAAANNVAFADKSRLREQTHSRWRS